MLAVASVTPLHPMPREFQQFAIFRINKLHTRAQIAKVGNHNDRRRKLPANIDPKRVEKNISYVPDKRPLTDRVAEKLSGIKHRKDAVQAVEILCALSSGAEKFVPIEDWATTSLAFIKKRFGEENLVSAVLHLDEKTPHLQAVIVPLAPDGKLSAKRLFGSPKLLSDLQTAYHNAVKKFGLQRGIKGSDREHISMRDFYQDQRSGMDILLEAIKTIPRKGALEGWPTYFVKIKDHLLQALSSLITAKTEAKVAREEAASLRRRVVELEHYAEAQVAALRSLPLVQVAEKLLGYPGQARGKQTIFEDDVRRIVITGVKFKDEKSSKRGDAGAISLVRQIFDVEFDHAVDLLARYFPQSAEVVELEAARHASTHIKTRIANASRQPVDFEESIKFFARPDPAKSAQLAGALTKSGIDREIVRRAMADNIIWANAAGSLCCTRKTAATMTFGVSVVSLSAGTIQFLGPDEAFFSLGKVRSASQLRLVASPLDALKHYASSGVPTVSLEGNRPTSSVISYLTDMGIKAVEVEGPIGSEFANAVKKVGINLRVNIPQRSTDKLIQRERQISGPKPRR